MRAVRIHKTYSADAIPLVREDRYLLAREIRGVGFRTADQLTAKLGIRKDSVLRARAGISDALIEVVANRDCGRTTCSIEFPSSVSETSCLACLHRQSAMV